MDLGGAVQSLFTTWDLEEKEEHPDSRIQYSSAFRRGKRGDTVRALSLGLPTKLGIASR